MQSSISKNNKSEKSELLAISQTHLTNKLWSEHQGIVMHWIVHFRWNLEWGNDPFPFRILVKYRIRQQNDSREKKFDERFASIDAKSARNVRWSSVHQRLGGRPVYHPCHCKPIRWTLQRSSVYISSKLNLVVSWICTSWLWIEAWMVKHLQIIVWSLLKLYLRSLNNLDNEHCQYDYMMLVFWLHKL